MLLPPTEKSPSPEIDEFARLFPPLPPRKRTNDNRRAPPAKRKKILPRQIPKKLPRQIPKVKRTVPRKAAPPPKPKRKIKAKPKPKPKPTLPKKKKTKFRDKPETPDLIVKREVISLVSDDEESKAEELPTLQESNIDEEESEEESDSLDGYNFTDGYVFMCNGKTEKECFERSLFGQVNRMWKNVQKIKSTTALFLLNFTQPRTMHGVFVPASAPGYNLEPNAWRGRFPSQVKFECVSKAMTRDPEVTMKRYNSRFMTKEEVWSIIKNMKKEEEKRSKANEKKPRPKKANSDNNKVRNITTRSHRLRIEAQSKGKKQGGNSAPTRRPLFEDGESSRNITTRSRRMRIEKKKIAVREQDKGGVNAEVLDRPEKVPPREAPKKKTDSDRYVPPPARRRPPPSRPSYRWRPPGRNDPPNLLIGGPSRSRVVVVRPVNQGYPEGPPMPHQPPWHNQGRAPPAGPPVQYRQMPPPPRIPRGDVRPKVVYVRARGDEERGRRKVYVVRRPAPDPGRRRSDSPNGAWPRSYENNGEYTTTVIRQPGHDFSKSYQATTTPARRGYMQRGPPTMEEENPWPEISPQGSPGQGVEIIEEYVDEAPMGPRHHVRRRQQVVWEEDQDLDYSAHTNVFAPSKQWITD